MTEFTFWVFFGYYFLSHLLLSFIGQLVSYFSNHPVDRMTGVEYRRYVYDTLEELKKNE